MVVLNEHYIIIIEIERITPIIESSILHIVRVACVPSYSWLSSLSMSQTLLIIIEICSYFSDYCCCVIIPYSEKINVGVSEVLNLNWQFGEFSRDSQNKSWSI